MDECIDTLGREQNISTIDANSGYWQTEVDRTVREKKSIHFSS